MKIRYFILLIILSVLAGDVSAQRTRTTRKSRVTRERDTTSFTDRLAYDIRIGNIGLTNGFSLSARPSAGYKFGKILSAGIGTRLYYQFVNVFGGQDYSLFDYGGFGYARAKIGESFYLQGEYAYSSFDYTEIAGFRYNIWYPLVGAGYTSGGDKWKYGLEIMFPLSENARDYGPSLEYWITFNYNF